MRTKKGELWHNKTIKDGDIAPWKDLQKKLNKDKRKEQRNNYILIWGGSSSMNIFLTSAFSSLQRPTLRKCLRLTILPISKYSFFFVLFFYLCSIFFANLSTVLYPHLWWSCLLNYIRLWWIYSYIKIWIYSSQKIIQTFVCVKLSIQIYQDIHLCQQFWKLV